MGVCLGVWLVARLVFKFFKSHINFAQLTDIPATINHCEFFIFSCSVRIYNSCICVYHNSIRETVDYVCTCMCVCIMLMIGGSFMREGNKLGDTGYGCCKINLRFFYYRFYKIR